MTEINQSGKKRCCPLTFSFFSGFVNSVILIFIGLILLLNNLGYLPWDIWKTLILFWPVLLIFWGLQILAGGNILLNIFFSILALAVLSLVILISFVISDTELKNWITHKFPGFGSNYLNILSPRMRSNSYSDIQTMKLVDFQNVEGVDTNIDIGMGKFNLYDNTSNYYLKVDSDYSDIKQKPTISRKKAGNTLVINIDYESDKFLLFGPAQQLNSDVYFGQPQIPTDLDIKIGAGTLTANLNTLEINRLNIEVGAGSIDLKFTQESIPKLNSQIAIGAGKANIQISGNLGLTKINIAI